MVNNAGCVLCGGPVDQPGRFCTACVGFQGKPAAPRREAQIRLAPVRLRLLEDLRWPLVALLFAGVGIAGARAAESWDATRQLRDALKVAGRLVPTDPRLHEVVQAERHLAVVQVGATAAIGLVFLLWWSIAYRNLDALGIQRRRRTAWAVISWFVPVVSLVAPKRVAEELFRGSDVDTPLGWRYRPGVMSGLVTAWWGCWLGSLVLPAAALTLVTPLAVAAGRITPAMAVAFGGAFVASASLLGVAGLCAAALVLQVTAGQVERARAIEEAGLLPSAPA